MTIQAPQFNPSTNTITIPNVDHVEFLIAGKPVEGEVVIRNNTTVRVRAERGYILDKSVEREHKFEVTKLERPAPEAEKETPEVPDQAEQGKPADPVVVNTAGSTPENARQQASKADAGQRNFGSSNR